MTDPLHIFLDANVYIDALISWGWNDYPLATIDTDLGPITGEPACVALRAVQEGVTIQGRRVVLHSSQRTLAFVKVKLVERYRWEDEVARVAIRRLLKVIFDSGGTVVRSGDITSPADVPGLDDVEDCYRIAEARRCGAELFLTQDRDILDTADAATPPLPIRPQQFADRSRADRAEPER